MMRVVIFGTVLILLGCLIGGCSETNREMAPQKLDHRSDEPFMAEIRKIATKREGFYFIGQPIDKQEIERRKNDLSHQKDFHLRNPETYNNLVSIPIFMGRF